MKNLLTAKEMKSVDENAQTLYHMPQSVLMERAALLVADEICRIFPEDPVIGGLIGPGNNGADALCACRILKSRGKKVAYYLSPKARERLTGALLLQKSIADAYHIQEVSSVSELDGCSLLIDGLYGNGLSRELSQEDADILRTAEGFVSHIVAVDIPSGISASDGSVCGYSMHADLTVTFAFEKAGHHLYPGRSFCGKVICGDIGIPQEALSGVQPPLRILEKKDAAELLPKRDPAGNKKTFGHVLVIAGCSTICGAVMFSALAAYRTGAGLVCVVSSDNNRTPLMQSCPEALFLSRESRDFEESFHKAIAKADSILIGPGIGTDREAKQLLKTVFEDAQVPVVLDADALNLIAEDTSILKRPHTELVLTPHMGEMARLSGESMSYLKTHPVAAAEDFSRDFQVNLVLKDAVSYIAIPYRPTAINENGCDAMASGGSGDVLAGVIAGLIAQGLSPEDAALLGPYLHGAAGSLAAESLGRSELASDLCEALSKVILSLTNML